MVQPTRQFTVATRLQHRVFRAPGRAPAAAIVCYYCATARMPVDPAHFGMIAVLNRSPGCQDVDRFSEGTAALDGGGIALLDRARGAGARVGGHAGKSVQAPASSHFF
jgi:hypothetical protein